MSTKIIKLIHPYLLVSRILDLLQPVALVAARIYVAWVFFASGLTKIKDWDTTLFLFEEEYSVPLLNHELAALLATVGELVFPIILAFGLLSRFGALSLSVINIVAVISLQEIAPAAYFLHVIWGILLTQVIIFGGGKFSADFFIKKKFVESIK